LRACFFNNILVGLISAKGFKVLYSYPLPYYSHYNNVIQNFLLIKSNWEAVMKELLKPGINWLAVFIPISFLINYVSPLKNDIALFTCSCLAMVVLSSLISTATEQLAVHVGSRIGGLLNATFSNLPEIIFGTVALYHGLSELVKAAMTGAIIGNLLFVLGHAMLAGGLKNGAHHRIPGAFHPHRLPGGFKGGR
jgi:hypothetical protein